jgi:hypothetical protein
MLSLLTKTVALLASLQSVAGLAISKSENKAVEVVRRANGPVNVVYFTNWYETVSTFCLSILRTLANSWAIGVSMTATTNRPISRLERSLICSTPS